MTESVIQLTQAKEIGEHIARMLMSENSVPEFGEKGVPVAVAARVFGKDATWIQAGIISGWLPIGAADSGQTAGYRSQTDGIRKKNQLLYQSQKVMGVDWVHMERRRKCKQKQLSISPQWRTL